MKLIVCRHGETEANAKGIMAGHLDTPLTDAGLLQIKDTTFKISTYLKSKKEHIDHVVSSDLGRAYRTANLIFYGLKSIGLVSRTVEFVGVEKSLREMCYGTYQYKPIKQVKEETDYYNVNYTYPEGENFRGVQNRVVDYINHATRIFMNDQVVLMVVHSGVIRAINDHYGQYSIYDGKNRKVSHRYVGIYTFDTHGKMKDYKEL